MGKNLPSKAEDAGWISLSPGTKIPHDRGVKPMCPATESTHSRAEVPMLQN